MRLARILLAMVLGLALAGPEAHQCPVHDQHGIAQHGSSRNHHHHDEQPKGHCTCPQPCCPGGVAVALPAAASHWTAVALPTVVISFEAIGAQLLPVRKHLLPFAQAPPPQV
ncbi:MAG TPA: hypothetical protein VE714_10245 [Gemmatimonadales bacterium]|nr:hypothetical protein [Gemmatimonadales bacterium]